MTGLLHTAAVAALPLLPSPLMRILSSRYIAGETLEQALTRIRKLQAQGFRTILDILGEDVTDESAARTVIRHYSEAATTVAKAGLDTYVSIKPTHVGLRLSEELATELYLDLVRHCDTLGIFVRVEMEDHTTVDATLRIFERLRGTFERVGLVLQSRLFRTLADIDALAPGPLNVRMVKGIYLEPAEIAHVDPQPISAAFFECSRKLFERGAYVSLATHDDTLADQLLEYCRTNEIGQDRYELQVLMGVRERLWQAWKRANEPVRVYVPYGPDWRAYSTRRLKKNPQILQHLMRDFFSRR
jgi:proline dehydrogenase